MDTGRRPAPKQVRAAKYKQQRGAISRQQTQAARAVEVTKVNAAGLLEFDRQDPGDQKAAQDEEHVHPVPASAAHRLQPWMAGGRGHVEEDDGRDADRAQSVQAWNVTVLACDRNSAVAMTGI